MFGGIAFLLDGNMCCGVTKDGEVVIRVGPGAYDRALLHRQARECDFTGRPLRGMVMLRPEGTRNPHLLRWVSQAITFAASLPGKDSNGRRRKGERREKIHASALRI